MNGYFRSPISINNANLIFLGKLFSHFNITDKHTLLISFCSVQNFKKIGIINVHPRQSLRGKVGKVSLPLKIHTFFTIFWKKLNLAERSLIKIWNLLFYVTVILLLLEAGGRVRRCLWSFMGTTCDKSCFIYLVSVFFTWPVVHDPTRVDIVARRCQSG